LDFNHKLWSRNIPEKVSIPITLKKYRRSNRRKFKERRKVYLEYYEETKKRIAKTTRKYSRNNLGV